MAHLREDRGVRPGRGRGNRRRAGGGRRGARGEDAPHPIVAGVRVRAGEGWNVEGGEGPSAGEDGGGRGARVARRGWRENSRGRLFA